MFCDIPHVPVIVDYLKILSSNAHPLVFEALFVLSPQPDIFSSPPLPSNASVLLPGPIVQVDICPTFGLS